MTFRKYRPLKPCPFCGHTPAPARTRRSEDGRAWIECACGVRGPKVDIDEAVMRAASATWQKRHRRPK